MLKVAAPAFADYGAGRMRDRAFNVEMAVMWARRPDAHGGLWCAGLQHSVYSQSQVDNQARSGAWVLPFDRVP